MTIHFEPKHRNVTISGKIAVGTSTLAKKLTHALDWQYINAGEIQRQYDRKHDIDENMRGALIRPDEHEREIENMTKKMLTEKNHVVYEAWLSGFVAKEIPKVLKVLLICSSDDVRVDRVANRDGLSIEEAKHLIKQREEENIIKWKKLYGDYDFWDPKYYDLVIDTYQTGQMETLGKVLDKLGYKGHLPK